MKPRFPCLLSLSDFFSGLERQQEQTHLIPYERSKQWRDCLSIFLDAGILAVSPRKPQTAPCAECDTPVTINKANGSVFVQCFASGCGLSRTLGEEELTQHESTSFAVADFITGQLNFSGPYRPLLTDRLLRLGKLEYPNGEYDVLLARGISWEDADHIFHLAMPRSARTNVLMLSLHGAEVETGNSRIVQVPLIDLIAVENRILVLRKDRILPKLRGVYSDAKETVLEESKKRFIAVFQEAVQAGQVKRGDKELWKKKAESEFGILAGTFNGIWREHAPESLKKPGALPKPKAASVYPLPPHIIRDGEIHRFGEQNRCWYAAHDDYAVAGDWKAERERVSWKAHDGHASTPQERRSLQEKIEREQKRYETEQRKRHFDAAGLAQELFTAAGNDGPSPYLQRKQAKPYGVRFSEGHLLVPMRDVAGTLWSVQKIFDDGRKHFLAGGRKKGCFHALGDLSSMAYVCEGYATAASIHEATGKPVVVCFDAGNLSPVIEELAKFYPVKHWIIAADDDAHGETNIGRMKAEEAAARHSCSVMPASVLRQRLASLAAGMGSELPSPDYFRIITPDMQETGVPDLTTDEGKQAIEEHLDGVRLLILDNLSSLLRRGKENEAESWMLVQSWLLELRKRGISVLLVHHANKSGGQRGTSKKEDVLDTVIMLKRPEEYDPGEGATFSVHYEKARGFHGEDAQPFEARLVEEDKALRWKVEALKETLLEQAKALQAEGKSQRDIAQLLGISPSSVNRLLRRGG